MNFIITFLISLYKASNLSEIVKSENNFIYFEIIFSDSIVFFISLIILTLSLSKKFISKTFFISIGLIINFIYLIDSFLLIHFNHHLTFTALKTFCELNDVTISFLNFKNLSLIFIFVIAHLTQLYLTSLIKFSTANKRLLILISVLILPFAFYFNTNVRDFQFPQYSIKNKLPKGNFSNLGFSSKEQHEGKERLLRESYDFPENNPNIILVILESISASYSKRTSGLGDFLPKFDELSKNGILFSNFFANYEISDGGLVSIINGMPPLPFPGSTLKILNSFKHQPSFVREAKKRGYFSEVIFSINSNFVGNREYFENFGVDKVWDTNNNDFLKKSPRCAIGGVADDAVYKLLLERINQKAISNKPYLMTALTSSSHLPWKDPLGVKNTKENVLKHVDDSLYWLHQELEKINFFTDGILIVLGDHPAPKASSEEERKKWGESSRYRTILSVQGAGLPKEVIENRFFQQSDLFHKLGSLDKKDQTLSPEVIIVPAFTRALWDDKKIGYFKVFDERKSLNSYSEGWALGNSIKWVNGRGSDQLEERIQSTRAAQQYFYSESSKSCEKIDFSHLQEVSKLNGSAIRFLKPELTSYPSLNESIYYQSKDFNIRNLISQNLTSIGLINPEFIFYLKIENPGTYWFKTTDEACLIIGDREIKMHNKLGIKNDYQRIYLKEGFYPVSLKYNDVHPSRRLNLLWKKQKEKKFSKIPNENIFLASGISARRANSSYHIAKNIYARPKYHEFNPDKLIAHRGLSRYAPENSLLAIELAKNAGFKIIEIDITMTKDNVAVVFHDPNLKRMFGLDANLKELNYSEIKNKSLGNMFFKKTLGLHPRIIEILKKTEDPWVKKIWSTKIPTLEETLRKFKNEKIKLFLDFKIHNIAFAEKILKIIQKTSSDKNVIIESTNIHLLKKVKEINPKIETILYSSGLKRHQKKDFNDVRSSHINGVDIAHNHIDIPIEQKPNDIKIYTFTLNSTKQIKKAMKLSDYVITDIDHISARHFKPLDFFNLNTSLVKVYKGKIPEEDIDFLDSEFFKVDLEDQTKQSMYIKHR